MTCQGVGVEVRKDSMRVTKGADVAVGLRPFIDGQVPLLIQLLGNAGIRLLPRQLLNA